MKSIPINMKELMTQGADRLAQEAHDQFVQRHMERERQKREQKKRDTEVSSAEIIRQPAESPA